MKQLIYNLALIILLLIVIALIVIDVRQIREKTSQCLFSPLTYGVSQLEKANHDNVSCECYFDRGGIIEVTSEKMVGKNG